MAPKQHFSLVLQKPFSESRYLISTGIYNLTCYICILPENSSILRIQKRALSLTPFFAVPITQSLKADGLNSGKRMVTTSVLSSIKELLVGYTTLTCPLISMSFKPLCRCSAAYEPSCEANLDNGSGQHFCDKSFPNTVSRWILSKFVRCMGRYSHREPPLRRYICFQGISISFIAFDLWILM